MIKNNVKVIINAGIHVLIAVQINRLIKNEENNAFIIYKDKIVNCRNITSIIELGVPQNAEITLMVDGPDEKNIFEKIIKILNGC